MSRHSIATPCPVLHQSNSSLFMQDDTTTTFDFTSAIRPSLRNVKPRRPRASIQFAIHEDIAQNVLKTEPNTSIRAKSDSTNVVTQSSMQHSCERNYSTKTSQSGLSSTIHPLRSSRLAQAPKRPAGRLSVVPETTTQDRNNSIQDDNTTTVLRPARRGTIYIPSDDTTMPSMYMGIFSPIKSYDVQVPTIEDPGLSDMTGIAAQMAEKRGSRKSMMGVAPRRAALRLSSRPVQEANVVVDKHGQGGGKENVPPGLEECEKRMLEMKLENGLETEDVKQQSSKYMKEQVKHPALQHGINSATSAIVQKPSAFSHLQSKMSQQGKLDSNTERLWKTRSQIRSIGSAPVQQIQKTFTRPIAANPKPPVPTRFVVPLIQPPKLVETHSLLNEDIQNSAMYEESWLDHQEIAITQLINNLFNSSKFDNKSNDQYTLRKQLLRTYNSNEMGLLYKRLNAALLYGALSIPKDSLDHGYSLYRDLGRKDRFISFWLRNYDLSYLQIALEVVVGRHVSSKEERAGSPSTTRPMLKKSIHTFIDTFLLRNEDGHPEPKNTNLEAWSYQRTVLRSLMLVKVLDMIKTDSDNNMIGCLFQPTSTLKSSITAVQLIMQMLNPAAGDTLRALGHLGYSVGHVQHALEEFDYTIENLAVDLRDGTRLTRLVELLLFPSSSNLQTTHDPEATTTVMMPEGESFDFQNGQTWPLSQHLKFPCSGRSPRLWNVQIALSAVQNVKGVGNLVEGITAEDIVDGYREKTIRFLWALVGKWGLTGLVNWEDVRWDTRRLLMRIPDNISIEVDDFDDFEDDRHSPESCRIMLKDWARAVAASKSIEIRNFTTSFADGKVFEAIVNEYEPHLQTTNSAITKDLDQRLINLGCSLQFAQLFSPSNTTHVFDRDFVLAALAFLCSRLLAPTRRARAASVIQQAWRKYWCKIEMKRQVRKKDIAIACAGVVNDRLVSTGSYGEEGFDGGKCLSSARIEGEDFGDGITSPVSISVSDGDIWLNL